MHQDYFHVIYAYVADVGGVPGLPTARLAVEEQRTNVLIYSYGLPLLYGLIMATPLNWRRTFMQLGIGLVMLTLIQTFGLTGEVLKTMAYGIQPAVQAALAEMPEYASLAHAASQVAEKNMLASLDRHGLSLELIGLIYQFGYLVLPAVAPVILWIAMNQRFLEELVGWNQSPESGSDALVEGKDGGGSNA
jgi:hypothetical protein